MKPTLEQWDATIRPHLLGIRDGVDICMRHTSHLVYRPDFETLAEEDLAKLEKFFTLALRKIQKARALYEDKPTTVS
jgi:hypothetical protein